LEALLAWELGGAYLDRAVGKREMLLWRKRDRALLKELAYGIARQRLRLDTELNNFLSGSIAELPPGARNVLRLGLYQLRFLERIPDYAAINESVSLIRKAGEPGMAPVLNAVLRKAAREERLELPDPASDPVGYLSLKESHPPWLVARWLERWPFEEVEKLLGFDNRPPPLSVRVNRLAVDSADLQLEWRRSGIKFETGRFLPYFLKVHPGVSPESLPGYSRGWFQVQDESSGLVSVLVSPEPGDCVIDVCSAPGGKATHMAELMNDEGLVVAVDENPGRIRLVAENKGRLRLRSIKLVIADGRNLWLRRADRVLVDAPCTGTGVLGRRPDLRWRRTPDDIDRLAGLQLAILRRAGEMLRPGGELVYSTCSLEPEENDGVVEKFLATAPRFEIVREAHGFDSFPVREGRLLITPQEHGIDGIYAVKMKKK